MFSKKKPTPPKRRNHDLSQFGLMEIPDDFDPSQGYGDDDADSDLEAELAAITRSEGAKKPKAPTKPKVLPSADLDRMVADSLRDIGSDEELSGDDDDPDLLGELQEITGDDPTETEAAPVPEPQLILPTSSVIVDVIKQRIEMYKTAEENAKATNDSTKARRLNRGLKTLQDFQKKVNAGKLVNIDDLPPEVYVKNADKTSEDPGEQNPQVISPTRPAPIVPTSSVSSPTTPFAAPDPSPEKHSSPIVPPIDSSAEKPMDPKMAAVHARLREYKVAALNAKRSGDITTAAQFVKIIKQFDAVIKMAEGGQEIDLSDMPPPPEQLKEFLEQMQAGDNSESQAQEPQPKPEPEPAKEIEVPTAPAKTLLEGLEQRLVKYKDVEQAAKNENNSSKARRFGRIIKQYEDAIKAHKRGKPIEIEELPCPPGYPPLPSGTDSVASPNIPPKAVAEDSSPESIRTIQPKKPPSPKKTTPSKPELTARTSGNQVSTNLAERQMQILLERQKEFKQAAIEAKKAGEIDQAKEYLKIYKGFEGLLNAASSGLPVDLNSLPIPPSQRSNLEDSFAIVTDGECDPNDGDADMSVRLEEQLAKQLMMCKNTRDHLRAMGDVAGMNRFENLALTVQKDLDLIRYSRKKKLPIPKFHYEKRTFNIVHCNTDLTDNELEINVVRGISYNVPNPKDIDTYVKIEFPYPQDYPFNTKTSLVKNTDSPDYDQKYTVEIQRTNRQCQRIFKRQAAKFEVYSRGGFLRSDILIGSVNVKLQALETKCEIHDSYDLMDGRKTVGGKLEVKVRLRNPILTKQIEKIDEKWLVIDALT